jgi:formiminoglutamase
LRKNDNDTKRSRCYVFLQNSEAKYVIIGIPEDIGIRANFGRPGQLQHGALKILPTYSISFCKGSQIIVLGQVNVCEMKEVEHLDFHDIDDRSKLSQLVEKLTKTFLISF